MIHYPTRYSPSIVRIYTLYTVMRPPLGSGVAFIPFPGNECGNAGDGDALESRMRGND
jgi:hypothetical protein